MPKITLRKSNRERVKMRIKGAIATSKDRPRISVFRSNKYIYAQIVDDRKHATLAESKGDKKVESAFKVGKDLAKKAVEKGVKEVVFDRSGYRYHGRVKRLAEGLREGGLVF